MEIEKNIKEIKKKNMEIENTKLFNPPYLFTDEFIDSYSLIKWILENKKLDKTETMILFDIMKKWNRTYFSEYISMKNLYIHENGYIENIDKKDYIYKSFLDIQKKLLSYIKGIIILTKETGLENNEIIEEFHFDFSYNENKIPTEKINFLFDYEE